jgi:hypothetical protein
MLEYTDPYLPCLITTSQTHQALAPWVLTIRSELFRLSPVDVDGALAFHATNLIYTRRPWGNMRTITYGRGSQVGLAHPKYFALTFEEIYGENSRISDY